MCPTAPIRKRLGIEAMAPERLGMAKIIAPELAASVDMVASGAVPTTRVIAVDAQALIVALDPEPDIQFGPHATVHMSDVPLELVSATGPTTADPIRSVWQSGSMSLRLLFDIAFVKRRANAAAYLDGAGWA